MEHGKGVNVFKVAIIGAGVSGLSACKHFSEQGFNVTVFEEKSFLGGVWRSTYPSTRLQTNKCNYQYADFRWPESTPMFPSHDQVLGYLEGYAIHFELFDKIQFNCGVIAAQKKMNSQNSQNMGNHNTSSSEIIPNTETTNLAPDQSAGEAGGAPLIKNLITESHKRGTCAEESNSGHFVWEVHVRQSVPDSAGSADVWHTFDYLLMCCGQFGGVAKMPTFPECRGPDVFDGQVLHSLHYSELDSVKAKELIYGKKVVVVGYGKTSLDLAVEAANMNEGRHTKQPCTLVFRRTHWFFPRDLKAFGLFPLSYLRATRLSLYWTPKPGQGWVQNLLQHIFGFVRLLVWKLLEYYLRFRIPIDRFGLVPEHTLLEDMSACILPEMPEDLFVHIEAGNIVPRKTTNWHFYRKGVRLADGTNIEADVVILCTGYDGPSKLKSILPEEYESVLCEPEGLLTLYRGGRGIIHPRIPNVAFLGYQEGISSLLLSEMSAIWLTCLLRQKFALPDVDTMEKERRTWLEHMKSTTRFFAGYCVSTTQIWHADNLCRDMGATFLRKKTWWQEIFSIYSSADYRSLILNRGSTH